LSKKQSPEQRKHFIEDHYLCEKHLKQKRTADLQLVSYGNSLMKYTELDWAKIPDVPLKWSLDSALYNHIAHGQYAHGGEIPTSPRKYFQAMSLSALPEKAASYITSEILTDNDIDLLEETDEDFVSVKNLIAETFPDAFPAPKSAEPEKPVKTEPTAEDYRAALEGAEVQLEFAKGKEKKNLKEYIDGLKVMIETMETMGKGGRIPSANARERKYTSKSQKHEQRYKKNRVTKIRYYKKQK